MFEGRGEVAAAGSMEAGGDGALKFSVKITAMGEVHDKDGVLVSTTPVEFDMELTGDQLTELGLPVPPHPNEEK